MISLIYFTGLYAADYTRLSLCGGTTIFNLNGYNCNISFDANSARDLIKKDMLNNLGRRMGVGTVYMNGGFDKYDDETKKIWDGGDNFIFRTLYKANPQRGFWEVEYLLRHMPSIPP